MNNIRVKLKENKLYIGDYEGHTLMVGVGSPWKNSSIEFIIDSDKIVNAVNILKWKEMGQNADKE